MNCVALAAMLGVLYASTAPGGYTLSLFACGLLWFLMAAVWLVRAAGLLICIRGFLRTPSTLRDHWPRWLIGPVASAITLALVSLDAPLHLGFAISRNDLSQLSRQALAAGPARDDYFSAPVRRAGIYQVSVAQVTSAGEVRFWVHGTEFFRSFSGFSYRPTGTPSDGGGSFRPLGGPWYEWHTSW
ncbi:MAG TPA: hypothetical protein VFC78_13545 [Tepidisphaeraceae bacterium]|nr:hypothetical protein [Tepidisphaeraceae bacterium]